MSLWCFVDITGYVERLHADLLSAAAAGGEQVVDAAERLAGSLDAAIRMALLEALSGAAAEITGALDGATVEVRLRGREPDFVVTVEDQSTPPTDASEAAVDDEDAAVARITLRLPEPLKQRAEVVAAAARQSLNTWLVEAVRTAATLDEPSSRRATRRRGSQHLSGWAH